MVHIVIKNIMHRPGILCRGRLDKYKGMCIKLGRQCLFLLFALLFQFGFPFEGLAFVG